MNIVETERIVLRKWHDDDAALVASIYVKPEVMQFIPSGVLRAQHFGSTLVKYEAFAATASK